MKNLFYKLKIKLILFHFKLKYFYKNYLYIYFKILFTILGLVSLFIIVLTYGTFYINTDSKIEEVSKIITYLIYYFIFYEIINLIFYRENINDGIIEYLLERRIEVLFMSLVVFFFLFDDFFLKYLYNLELKENRIMLIYLTFIQILIFINNFFHFSRNISNLKYKMINPSLIVFLSFLIVISIGLLLLSLPKVHQKPHQFVDIVFMIVSATCVTGLSTLDVSKDFHFLGQLVILIWIQLGGLGIMTLTSFFSYYFSGRVSLTNQILMRELFSEISLDKVKKIIKDVTIYTFVIESLGALFLYLSLPDSIIPSNESKIFYAIFHSISAFCNAGFSLFSDSLFTLSKYSHIPIYIIMILIILGGLGFTVIQDLVGKLYNKRHRLTLTTKIALVANIILWLFGFLIFLFFSYIYDFKNQFRLSNFDLITHALFFTVTPRTAGFNILFYNDFPLPLILITFILMWIGASPNSTGGGIKTTTITIAILHLISILLGRKKVQFFYFKINEEVVMRSYTIVLLSLTFIFLNIFLLSIFERIDFLKLSFEVVSAYGTVGLSLGITPNLSTPSKIILSILMFMGRIGILTFMLALIPKQKEKKYEYPSQYVVLG